MNQFEIKIVPMTVSLDKDNMTPVKAYRKIERHARVCYKSEDKMTETSFEKMIEQLIARDHSAMLEHVSFTAVFNVDRGVSHELVRHRICSFAQESTRYVNYGNKGIEICSPIEYKTSGHGCRREWGAAWRRAALHSCFEYLRLIEMGSSPQNARAVLPTCLKTTIVVTANVREWRHIYYERCSRFAHPDTRFVMMQCFAKMSKKYPLFFKDLEGRFKGDTPRSTAVQAN